ncbi:hypothetical protein CDN99_22380 [Roseateles aquatilis]|uniref:Beta-lactamase-related domain-containing protein n=1 Tax=Roseateles aquatilis TaxID=431061 RepID=A0A2D0AM37_9BURK|nr:serine hydrolase domain-containing protein [Roseateles aquatilis]OWQ85290.1 hypothetical protein CDN99_22380 [Roseateles aquatilis]
MVNGISAAIGLVAVLSGLGGSAHAATPSASDIENKTAAIERVLQGEMTARGIPGAQISIVQRGKVVFTGAYGQANVEAATPVTKQTVFGINSISKAVTGVAAMQLVEAGKLDLDRPAVTYVDSLPESWKEVTVRQLLTHTSGLPEIVDDNVRAIDGAEPAAAWAKVQELPLNFPPGTRFSYTQTNYVLMGKVIEKITGRSFSDFVRERQFNVAGMKQTGFAQPAGTQPQVASLYTYMTLLMKGMKTVGVERSKDLLPRQEVMLEYVYPTGGVQSTSTDLAEWVLALQKLKLVSKGSLEQLSKPLTLKDGTSRGFNASVNAYGLGWPSMQRPAHPAITLIGGERAAVFIYPEDDLSIIVLTNLMGAAPQKFIDKIAAIYIPGLNVENK